MEVPAFGLDRAAGLAGILLLPLRHHKIVGFHFEEPLEDQREALCGGFLQCENFDVVVVESEVSPVALEKRVAELSIEESVVPEPGESNLQRRKVQCSIQDPECILLVEQAHGQEVADLQDEATEFLVENRLPFADLRVEENDLLPCGKGGPQLSQRSKWVAWEFEQNTAHSPL